MVPPASRQHAAAAATRGSIPRPLSRDAPAPASSFIPADALLRSDGGRAWIRLHFAHQTCLGTKLLEQIQTRSPPRV